MRMTWLALLVLTAALALGSGCRSTDMGSREYVPGQGWVPVDR